MLNLKTRTLFIEVTSAFFILLFVYTSATKLIEPDIFNATLSKMPYLGQFATVLTFGIPLSELVIATLLFFPRFRIQGLLFSTILMTVFTAFISFMLITESTLPCSCGGVINIMGWETHLIFNFLCVGIAMTAWKMAVRVQRVKSSF